MKRLPIIALLVALAAAVLPGCHSNKDNEVYDSYAEWREKNEEWLQQQQARTNPDGTPYYKAVVPMWNPNAYVLIHYLSDRAETEGNLTPLYTSTIDTRYHLSYYEGTPIDSSYNMTAYGPGIFRSQISSLISGWAIAMEDMRVGDSAEVVIPYQMGYGVSTSGNVLPFSNLKFNIRLVDIVDYEKNPK